MCYVRMGAVAVAVLFVCSDCKDMLPDYGMSVGSGGSCSFLEDEWREMGEPECIGPRSVDGGHENCTMQVFYGMTCNGTDSSTPHADSYVCNSEGECVFHTEWSAEQAANHDPCEDWACPDPNYECSLYENGSPYCGPTDEAWAESQTLEARCARLQEVAPCDSWEECQEITYNGNTHVGCVMVSNTPNCLLVEEWLAQGQDRWCNNLHFSDGSCEFELTPPAHPCALPDESWRCDGEGHCLQYSEEEICDLELKAIGGHCQKDWHCGRCINSLGYGGIPCCKPPEGYVKTDEEICEDFIEQNGLCAEGYECMVYPAGSDHPGTPFCGGLG